MIKNLRKASHLLLMTSCVLGFASEYSWSQVPLTSTGTAYEQNFNTLLNIGTGNALPAGWVFTEAGTSANTTYAAGTGSDNSGNTYSFGSAGSSERALGGLLSGSLVPTIGANFTNNTSSVITSLQIGYAGEQWRLGSNTVGRPADRMDFQYSINATSLTNGEWIDINELDFSSPVITGTVGALNGNNAKDSLSFTITNLNIPGGATFWIRWNDVNITGADDGLSIDNFALTPFGQPAGSLKLSVSDATITEGNDGSKTALFTVSLTSTSESGTAEVTIATTDETATIADTDYVAASTSEAVTVSVGQPYEFAVPVTGDVKPEDDETFLVTISTDTPGVTITKAQGKGTIVNDDLTPVYQIQSSGLSSPKVGQKVITTGVVTGDFQKNTGLNGFFIQDANGDNDPTTSDGIFVFIPASNSQFYNTDVNPGDLVQVAGTVREFSTATQLEFITELSIIGAGTVAAVGINLPVTAKSEWERYEGMLVTKPQNVNLTVTEHFQLGRFGQVVLTSGGRLYNPTNTIDASENPDQVVATLTANELRKVILDDGSSTENPQNIPFLGPQGASPALQTLRLGSTVTQLTGVLDYRFSDYRIHFTTPPVFDYNANPRPVTPPHVGEEANLKVASFNVLNYFTTPNARGANRPGEFDRQRKKIILAIQQLNADVVGLIEIENNGDGDDSAIKNLVDGLNENAQQADKYAYIQDPEFTIPDGITMDEIKQTIIYKPSKVSLLGNAMLSMDASFVIDVKVDNKIIKSARYPVAQTFALKSNGERFSVVVNHFKSKNPGELATGGDLDGIQGNYNATRVKQAAATLAFVETIKETAQDDDVLLIGDFNAYNEEDPIDKLREGGLISLTEGDKYSYVFGGQSGSLDHAIITPSLKNQITGSDKWHINADEPNIKDYNLDFNRPAELYNADSYRSSDHDPVLVGLRLFTPEVNFTISNVTKQEGSGAYEVVVTTGNNAPYKDITLQITAASARDVRYGQKRDYTTTPEPLNQVITVKMLAHTTSASFLVTPQLDDDNEKNDEQILFTINPVSDVRQAGYKLGNVSAFTFTITDIKKNMGSAVMPFSISPNPTTGSIYITAGSEDQVIEAIVRSPQGEILYQKKGNIYEISQQISQILGSKQSGLYNLQLIGEKNVANLKIMKW